MGIDVKSLYNAVNQLAEDFAMFTMIDQAELCGMIELANRLKGNCRKQACEIIRDLINVKAKELKRRELECKTIASE